MKNKLNNLLPISHQPDYTFTVYSKMFFSRSYTILKKHNYIILYHKITEQTIH